MVLFHKIIHLVWFSVYKWVYAPQRSDSPETHTHSHINCISCERVRCALVILFMVSRIISVIVVARFAASSTRCVCMHVTIVVRSVQTILSFLWLLIWMFLRARKPKYHVLMIFFRWFLVVILMLARNSITFDSRTACLNVVETTTCIYFLVIHISPLVASSSAAAEATAAAATASLSTLWFPLWFVNFYDWLTGRPRFLISFPFSLVCFRTRGLAH